jgi:uroporphyrinogen III methyltransferase/synthase
MPETRTRVIALTRERDDRALFARLTTHGVTVVAAPLLRRVQRSPETLAARLVQRPPDAVVVTSAAGAQALAAACARLGEDHGAVARLRGPSVAAWAVGPASAAALEEALGRPVSGLPEDVSGAGLVSHLASLQKGLHAHSVAGRRVLFPAAEAALRVVPDGLRALGAEVDEVVCYATEPDPAGPARVAEVRALGPVLWVLASPSAVGALAAAHSGEVPAVAVIGPTTAAAARQVGFSVRVEAVRHTVEGLVEAIAAWLELRAG